MRSNASILASWFRVAPMGRRVALVLAVALMMLVTEPAGGNARGGDTLVIGVGRDFYEGTESRTFLHGSTNTWESLTYIDENMRAVPWLATSWESSADGRQWTFHLRRGVRFHDGTPMTARDAVRSIERIRSHPVYDPTENYRQVASVSARDDHCLVFQLTASVPHFPKLVAHYSSPVLKSGDFEATGRIKKFVATGPYMPAHIQPGEEIRLEAFGDYWGPAPRWRRVVFRKIPDAQARLMALLAADIDAIADVGGILPEQAGQLESESGVVLKSVEVATTHTLLFNCRRPGLSDPAVRRWIAGIVDRDGLVAALTRGSGVVAHDPYTRMSREYTFGLIRPVARETPAMGLQSLKLLLHGGTLQRWPYLEMAQVIQEVLRGYGLPARIEIREAGGYHEAVKKGGFDLAIQPYTLMTGDPDFFYTYFIAVGAPRNLGYMNPKADRLIQSARREMDPVLRRETYKRLAEIMARDMPLLPLYFDVSFYAHRKAVDAFEMDHFFRPILTKGVPWQ